jgi:two-component system, sensor histidine kinase and response regulator
VLALLDQQPFDLVLMDLQMPGRGGLDTAALIRASEKETAHRLPIVALTAHVMKGDRERCLAGGMDGYVGKPISEGELWREIERVCPDLHRTVPPRAALLRDSGLDRQAILGRLDGDEKLLREIVNLFLVRSPQMLEQIRQGLATDNARAVSTAAHSLKGSVSTFSQTEVFGTLQELEDSAHSGDLHKAKNLFATLESKLTSFHPALAELGAA